MGLEFDSAAGVTKRSSCHLVVEQSVLLWRYSDGCVWNTQMVKRCGNNYSHWENWSEGWAADAHEGLPCKHSSPLIEWAPSQVAFNLHLKVQWQSEITAADAMMPPPSPAALYSHPKHGWQDCWWIKWRRAKGSAKGDALGEGDAKLGACKLV